MVRGLEMYSESVGSTIFIKDAGTNELETPGRDFKAYSYCEALWDMSESADISILRAFNKHIDRFVNDQPEEFRDEAIWAYGPTVAREIPKVVAELRKDSKSRRAIISIPRDLEAIGTHPCLVSIQFLVRDGEVHSVVNMRSNDAWLGFPIDIFQFSLMQHTVAGALELPVGSYTHHAASLHLYSRDVSSARILLEKKDEIKFSMMREIDPNGVDFIQKGYLLGELKEIAAGRDFSRGVPFNHYLNYLQETWFKKNGSK
jgi:thymidylate synthase